jgi:signal transduction histidine kinase
VRARLVAAFLAVTAVVLAILVVPLGITTADREEEDLVAAMQRDAFALADLVEDTLEGTDEIDMVSVAERYTESTGARLVIVDAEGIAVADSDSPSADAIGRSFAGRDEFASALAGEVATGSRTSETLGTTLLYVAVPVASAGDIYGALRVSYPRDEVDERARNYWLALGGIAVVSLLAAGGLGVALAGWVVRPLSRLEAAAGSLGAGDLTVRAAAVGGPPEVRELARAFDDMAARLEQVVGSQEAFVADASHQLRTPLTALRLRIENAATDVDGVARDELLAALEETGRLSRLVDGLLALARADRVSPLQSATPVSLHEVAEERVAAWEPAAAELDIDLVLDAPAASDDDVLVLVDRERLLQVVDNLVANAVDAVAGSAGGGSVRVGVERDGSWLALHVTDDGPGLDAAQRERAFDRFWRAPSVVADARFGGTGLGLAICRRLVEADGGTIELDEAATGGIDAVVRYPVTGG